MNFETYIDTEGRKRLRLVLGSGCRVKDLTGIQLARPTCFSNYSLAVSP